MTHSKFEMNKWWKLSNTLWSMAYDIFGRSISTYNLYGDHRDHSIFHQHWKAQLKLIFISCGISNCNCIPLFLVFGAINYSCMIYRMLYIYLQVYLVFRSGGKPPEDSMGLGVKSSGAKFICRSQARPLTNPYPSTATSSTTPLGTHIGMYYFVVVLAMAFSLIVSHTHTQAFTTCHTPS